ncbi:SPOR domain-containing protein [Sediminitomix flava]|uniref:Sporulation related protein n=1 Tax=Sediminitomix flava TaxID=379075 RepID=A0A315ZAI1_SEDFL|nr:SPOR domain-containing protein [Sediminitomix flava]PWJ42292.1 sporulation related protein [Sediminitomix flava]
MKVHKYIKQQLEENKIAVIPQLGTFRSTSHNADMSDSGNLISPPDEAIIFEEDFQEQVNHSIASYIEKKTGEDEIDIATEVQLYVSTIKQTLNAEGIAEIEGLGYFTKDNGLISFNQFDEVNINPESFGLPKINASPIIDDQEDDDSSANKGNTTLKALLLVGLILVVVGGGGAYYFMTQDSSTTQTVAQEEEKVTDKVEEANTDIIQEEELSGPVDLEENVSTPVVEETKVEEKPVKKATTTSKTTKSKTSYAGVLEEKTGQYYVIVSSFSNLENAKKSVRGFKKDGYTNAQIIRTPTKYRVALDGFNNKSEAKSLQEKVNSSFPGSWVWKN